MEMLKKKIWEDALLHMCFKMNQKKLYEEFELPQDIEAEIKDREIIIKKGDNLSRRKINLLIDAKIEGNKIILSSRKDKKINKRIFGTAKAHINNIIKGLTEGFNYKLQIANVHFPMNVSYEKSSNEIIVKNFLGEKKDRRIKLVDGVEVNIDKDIIEIKSTDIEKAGQSAANIEKGVKVRNKDRRIYQDGIFIIEKPGRSYL
jgi:large subunit ribosomal protein L6